MQAGKDGPVKQLTRYALSLNVRDLRLLAVYST